MHYTHIIMIETVKDALYMKIKQRPKACSKTPTKTAKAKVETHREKSNAYGKQEQKQSEENEDSDVTGNRGNKHFPGRPRIKWPPQKRPKNQGKYQ